MYFLFLLINRIKVFVYITICEFQKLDLKISEVYCNQSFHISPYAKFESLIKNLQSLLWPKFLYLTMYKIRSLIENLRGLLQSKFSYLTICKIQKVGC